jgi:Tfp pilus assembly protein PilN
MIKINLLPQKRAKRPGAQREPGAKDALIGVAALAGAAALVFLAVDQPKRNKIADLNEANRNLDKEISSKQKQLQGYEDLKKAADDAEERQKSIARLMAAKVVPAGVLHELSKMLKAGELPTMTTETAKETGNGPESNPNRRLDLAWDPTHVWITSFVDNAGGFSLEGNAQAEVDVVQLSKRLQASVYFSEVSQQTEERVTDRANGITYYKFLITGKVAY